MNIRRRLVTLGVWIGIVLSAGLSYSFMCRYPFLFRMPATVPFRPFNKDEWALPGGLRRIKDDTKITPRRTMLSDVRRKLVIDALDREQCRLMLGEPEYETEHSDEYSIGYCLDCFGPDVTTLKLVFRHDGVLSIVSVVNH